MRNRRTKPTGISSGAWDKILAICREFTPKHKAIDLTHRFAAILIEESCEIALATYEDAAQLASELLVKKSRNEVSLACLVDRIELKADYGSQPVKQKKPSRS